MSRSLDFILKYPTCQRACICRVFSTFPTLIAFVHPQPTTSRLAHHKLQTVHVSLKQPPPVETCRVVRHKQPGDWIGPSFSGGGRNWRSSCTTSLSVFCYTNHRSDYHGVRECSSQQVNVHQSGSCRRSLIHIRT